MLQIKNLNVRVEEKEILRDVSLDFSLGKTYFLLGKNGSGKSSLAFSLLGHPKYTISSGTITVEWKDITAESPDVCSHAGLFLSFQHVPELKWIRLVEYLRTIYNTHLTRKNPDTKPLTPFVFLRFVRSFLSELHIDEKMLDRDLNVGFSGGEKRKIEILQMKLLDPKYIILDEIDSGLDIDAFRTIASFLAKEKNDERCYIIITHNFKMAEFLTPDEVIVLQKWEIVRRGGGELVDEIGEKGFEK